MADETEETARAIALLEATHQFPVAYDLSVITVSDEAVVAEVHAVVGVDAYQTVPSSGGKYVSQRFRVPCEAAADVLALHARIRRVTGVITVI